MYTNKPKGGIERKILTSILWVGILPVTIALLVGLFAVRVGQGNAVKETLATAAETTATGVRFGAHSLLRTVRSLASDPEVVAALTRDNASGQPRIVATPEAFERLLARLRREAKSADGEASVLSLYDPQGLLVASTDERTQAKDLSPFSWVRKVNRPKFVDVDYVADENQYTARIVAPVFSSDASEYLGFVSEVARITSLIRFALGRGGRDQGKDSETDIYQAVYASEGGMVSCYLDDSGPVAAPPLVSEAVDSTLGERLRDDSPQDSGALRLRNYVSQGRTQDVFLAYHRLFEDYDIYLVVYRPASVAFTNINIGAALAVFVGSLAIAFLCVIAYRNVHNNIVRPLSLLNEGAQIIRQGDLDLKLVIGTGDEIEELASSFNKMALALKGNIRQLGESEEKYRSLVTSMRDGIYQTDPEGIITFLNPAGCEIYGYSSSGEAIGQNLRELFLEEIDLARYSSELDTNEFIERSRIWMKRKDGRTIFVELTANRMHDDNRETIGIEGTFRDVTKSVRLEQEARERSERISAITQIANVINSSLEAGRVYESLVVEVKKLVNFDYAALALVNEDGAAFDARQLWPEQEVHPGYTYQLDGKESCAAWVARHRRCLVVNDLHVGNSRYAGQFPKDTRSCVGVPLYATGRIIGTLNLGAKHVNAFTKHDVEVLEQLAPHVAVAIRNAQLLENLQVSLEEVTRAREKLHEANEELKTLDEMKTNLLSNVSHELRTPLVSVMGYTDMIYNGKAGPIDDIQREYLAICLRNIDKLVTLIENLLDFSRLHRGAEKLVFDTFDLVDCARTSMQIIQPVADGREIALELVASEGQVFVEGDKGKMGQVFNNLLSNAVKFNHNGGGVTLEIRRGEEEVEVAVSDTGIGIPSEALDKVFTRFYQYDSSSTRKYGGTGIGLAIAQDIVRFHGSRITVTSEVGKGSVFRFSLPTRAPQKDEVQPVEQESPLPTETRLLVELITEDRALSVEVRNQLVSEGMDVIHAASPTYAIALAQKHSPDCILVDVDGMGGAKLPAGRDVVEGFLADPTVGPVPLIMLTNDDELYARYESRVAGRVMRGFRKSTLLSGIHHAVSGGVEVATDGGRGAGVEPVGSKILCVDDDPEILTFLSRCLTAEGYEVDGCESGEEAIERVATREYGLVLLDIAMPGVDGWETCRRIKSDASLNGIKVCMVTAKPVGVSKHARDGGMPQGAGASSRAYWAGADGYLLKPFRPEDILGVVQSLEAVHTTKET